jgi:hypothetical protein
MKRIVLMVTVALVMAAMMALAGPASATIHPIVESFDCANEQAFAHHPLGDPADPPGQTPGATPGQGNNELRALIVVTDGFTDFSSPALFGHKLDGQCGQVGQLERRAR